MKVLSVRLFCPWSVSGLASCTVPRLQVRPLVSAFAEFRVQSLFEPNTANRPRKPYKPLLASSYNEDLNSLNSPRR
eukprot:scaffold54899_cov77-Phaeocystis_antarctica.AAC.2